MQSSDGALAKNPVLAALIVGVAIVIAALLLRPNPEPTAPAPEPVNIQPTPFQPCVEAPGLYPITCGDGS